MTGANGAGGSVREQAREIASAALGPPTWWDGLLWAGSRPKACLANVAHALRAHPELEGRLAWNALAVAPWVVGALPWAPVAPDRYGREWDTGDDLGLCEFLEREGLTVSAENVGRGVERVARAAEFHPVRAYLDRLAWDGEPRVETWLPRYLGAADTAYVRAVGARWLVAAVARVFWPGCKVDTVPILEGSQGAGKSTALRILGAPWYSDDMPDLSAGKEAALALRGVWIVEVPELDAFTGAEATRIKAFFSRATDRYRPPYAARLVEVPRSCVVAATTNAATYLKDETGARRFWPVAVGALDRPALERDRDQIWAEAVALYEQGEHWWLDSVGLEALAAEEQRARFHEDPWTQRVLAFAERHWAPDGVTLDAVLTDTLGLNMAIDRVRKADGDRVARILRAEGWRVTRPRVKADGRVARVRRFVPPGMDTGGDG